MIRIVYSFQLSDSNERLRINRMIISIDNIVTMTKIGALTGTDSG